jgi:hypothetical protein
MIYKTLIAALAMIVGASLPAKSQGTSLTGDDLYEACRTEKYSEKIGFSQGYCLGVIAGVTASLQGQDIGPKMRICRDKSVNDAQILKIVLNYLDKNPQYRTRSFEYVVWLAMRSSFPCAN